MFGFRDWGLGFSDTGTLPCLNPGGISRRSRNRSMDRSVKVPSLGRLLGGSWVVISRVISPLIGVIIVTLLITPLITTHEPPSKAWGPGGSRARFLFLKMPTRTQQERGLQVLWCLGFPKPQTLNFLSPKPAARMGVHHSAHALKWGSQPQQ